MGQVDSRRDRNKAEKRERIFVAARDLFAERGFNAVTTQEISDRADVAAGTLFLYAATKGELILWVENAAVEEALADGIRRAAYEPDLTDAIVAIVDAVLERGAEHPENTAAYQRELLFGPADEQHRADALRVMRRLQDEIARRLAGDRATAAADHTAARSIFGALHLAAVTPYPDRHEQRRAVREQITQIVRGHQTAEH